jgi:Na+(H+)/acetate symporter ActP
MWVMILIGVFYLFPPVFGVMGRNLLPELYSGIGAKGTDKIVLELPRILNPMENAKSSILNAQSSTNSLNIENRASAIEHRKGIPWGSILSGITCAGAFAAFMSTFSGLLVSMTGAMAHDVYGRIFRPKSTPEQRLRAFKIAAVLIGGVAIVLGCFVEPLEINFMVGQAFAIAAASYFPLLFMSVWWRGMTVRGAATGMLAGGLCALASVALTNVSNLALDKGPMGKIFASFAPLNDFWAAHPLLRILCEQPAIWTVPLAIGLMIVVSKATRKDVPSDVRMNVTRASPTFTPLAVTVNSNDCLGDNRGYAGNVTFLPLTVPPLEAETGSISAGNSTTTLTLVSSAVPWLVTLTA